MKCFFTTLLFSIMSVGMAIADSNVSYSWESPNGTAIETGGTVTYENGDGRDRVNYPFDYNTKDNVKYYTLSIMGLYASIGNSASVDAGYINISLDKPLKAGDTISVTGFRSAENDGKGTLTLIYGNGNVQADPSTYPNIYFKDQDPSTDFGNDGFVPKTNKIIVPVGAAGSKIIKLTRGEADASLYITKFSVANEIIVPKLLSIEPKDSSTVVKFAKDDILKFTTNFDDSCGGFDVSIIDNEKLAKGDVSAKLYSDFVSTKDASRWCLKFYKDIELTGNHHFTVKLVGHKDASAQSPEVATVSATYIGGGATYQYSNTKISNVTPGNGSEIKDVSDNKITVKFSAKASIDATKSNIITENNTEEEIESISTVNDSTYVITIPASVISHATSEFSLNIYAIDSVGNIIKGNDGLEENSYTGITYKCNLGVPDFTVKPAEGNVNSLSVFEFSYVDGIADGITVNPIVLYAGDKTTPIENVSSVTVNGSKLTATLSADVTTKGTYYLYIPGSRFKLAGKYNSKETWMKFVVVDPKTDYHVTMNPADSSIVESLSVFTIAFDKWTNAIPYGTYITPVLEDTEGNVISKSTCAFMHDNVCSITLDSKVKKAGTYILRIPEKCFVLGDWGNDLSEEMFFIYTVVPGENPGDSITLTPANKSVVASLKSITLKFEKIKYSDVAVITDYPTLVNSVGTVVAKGTARWGTSNKEIVIDLDKEITTNGTYTLNIPANLFVLDKEVYDKALSYTFTVDNTTSVKSVGYGENSIVNVYNLQGVLVRQGNAKEVLEDLQGVYIVNGKKMVLKAK